MSFSTPLLNICFILAIFNLEGNTPVLNELLQMYVRGLNITGVTLAKMYMLISSKSVDFVRVHAFTVLKTSSSSTGFTYRQFSSLPPK